ncbi:MAG: hypothetical protein IT287_04765 [Bdellovibrionaceae bacterium]|nr:hypothetical protein [Pseudobdellovibrionaceae bacterium]
MIDFRNPYIWDDLNDSVKQKLGSSVPVRVYQSVNHALVEIGMAFQGLYSMKRQYLTTLSSLGTHAEDMTVFLSRQGIKATPQDPISSLETIDDKKTLFWILDRDDAISGQKYIAESLVRSDSKIFRIFVSHSQHLFKWPDSNIGESDIHVLHHPATGGAIALFGRRTQNINSPFCSALNWNNFLDIGSFPIYKEDKSWIQKIESTHFMGSTPLLTNISERIYDRAIIFWKDRDASSIRDLLIADHGISPQDVECLSLSRWLDTRVLSQFALRGWDANTFRGTLILSSRLSSIAGFEQKLIQTLEKLNKLTQLKDV